MTGSTQRAVLFRYALTGVSVSSLYAVLHFALSSLGGLDMSIASAVALTAAIVFQYVMHARFTYRGEWRDAGQAARFGAAILIGLAVSFAVMDWIGPALGLPEIARVVLVIVILPVTNFLLFTLWVFAGGPKSP
ncbi:MAG: GtrA family protein [Pseudomonadota bacterium]